MSCLCRAGSDQQPDVIIVSTGLWHMLHVGSPKGYQAAVSDLKQQSEVLVLKQVNHTGFQTCQDGTGPLSMIKRHV